MATGKKQPFKATTVEATKPVVDDKLKPTAEVHLLVGGPYKKKNGGISAYGHCALRLKSDKFDLLYDFGRYGAVNWVGTAYSAASNGAKGDGILRVWYNPTEYQRQENALFRKTTGFMYLVYDHQVNRAKALMDKLIKAAEPLTGKNDEFMAVYKTVDRYFATGPNCTTLSVDGAEKAIVKLMVGQEKYWKPEDVLEGAELRLVNMLTDESRLFLPENLRKFLLEGCTIKNNGVTIHYTPPPPPPPAAPKAAPKAAP